MSYYKQGVEIGAVFSKDSFFGKLERVATKQVKKAEAKARSEIRKEAAAGAKKEMTPYIVGGLLLGGAALFMAVKK
jgi:uridine phosphorylase